MREGKLLQWDTPYNLYHEPANRFVADFIGQGVFLRGTLLTPETIETEIGVHKGNRAYDWGRGRRSNCCCGRMTSYRIRGVRSGPRWRRRRFAARKYSTPCACPAAAG